MAALNPGILLKLLQSMNSDAKVAGDHRTPLLQVIGILPALSPADSLWPHHGFLVQLSDSLNCTYVSLSDRDAELILNNRLQIGQFVHIDRLVFDSPPVPTAVSLRPVVGRYRFIGSPEALIVRSSPAKDGFVIQPVSESDPSVDPIAAYLSRAGKNQTEEEKCRASKQVIDLKENVNLNVTGKPGDDCTNGKSCLDKVSQRFISPGKQKQRSVSNGKRSSAPDRDPSPAGRSGKRSSSPAPSKCVVPSLVAAKEENRQTSREAAIIVPSRYRQPSPTGGRRQVTPVAARRTSMSPGRRLSGVFKKSPADSLGKKEVSKVSDGLTEIRKPSRKSWGDGSTSGGSEGKEQVSETRKKLDLQAILRTQVAISRRLSDVHENLINDESSRNHGGEEKSNGTAPVIAIHEKKWTDGSVSLDMVSSGLAKLGKDAMQRRRIASAAAAEALEEAIATDSLVRNLSMFSDLVTVSKPENPLPTIDRFMSIYEEVLNSTMDAESIAGIRMLSRSTDNNNENHNTSTEQSKFSTLWVEAALATNLEVVSLLTNDYFTSSPKTEHTSKNRHSVNAPVTANSKKDSTSALKQWTRGLGMNETVELGKNLQTEMQLWFVSFVEESLDAGFRVSANCSPNGGGLDCDSIAAILSQLKRVNDWLDCEVSKRNAMMMEKIDRLKKKIYGFVIQHVGNTTVAAVPSSNSPCP